MKEPLVEVPRPWSGDPLGHRGKFCHLTLPELRPRPRQLPHPPIWRAASSAGSIRECGRLGVPMMTARIPLARVRERMDLYEAGLAESGLDATTRMKRRGGGPGWRLVFRAGKPAPA